MTRTLLLVSYCFPPILTAEAILVTRTIRALDDLGWHATVLTVDPRSTTGQHDAALRERIPASAEVHMTKTFERSLAFARRAALRALLQLGLPEEQLLWYPTASRAGRALLAARPFDAMLSWASFQASNVVGLSLKRATGIPWIAHFSDPWVRSPYFPGRPLQRLTASRLEGAIFAEADALTFTTQETVELVMRGRPAAWRARSIVVPHGYEEPGEPRPRREPGGPLRIVHTGQFYKGKRTPLPLFEALLRLGGSKALAGRLRVVFVGLTLPEYVAAVTRAGLDQVVEFTGQRPATEAQRMAAGADVLLVMDAPSIGPSVFLPSKLVDYLALRKPIIGLTPEIGASAGLLHRAGCATAAPDDVIAIAARIDELLVAYESGGRIGLAVPDALLAVAPAYEVHATTRLLVRALERISASR